MEKSIHLSRPVKGVYHSVSKQTEKIYTSLLSQAYSFSFFFKKNPANLGLKFEKQLTISIMGMNSVQTINRWAVFFFVFFLSRQDSFLNINFVHLAETAERFCQQ